MASLGQPSAWEELPDEVLLQILSCMCDILPDNILNILTTRFPRSRAEANPTATARL